MAEARPVLRAVAGADRGRALTEFASSSGCSVIAEGIEAAAELDEVGAAGITLGQGFLLGRPQRDWKLTEITAGWPPRSREAALGMVRRG